MEGGGSVAVVVLLHLSPHGAWCLVNYPRHFLACVGGVSMGVCSFTSHQASKQSHLSEDGCEDVSFTPPPFSDNVFTF